MSEHRIKQLNEIQKQRLGRVADNLSDENLAELREQIAVESGKPFLATSSRSRRWLDPQRRVWIFEYLTADGIPDRLEAPTLEDLELGILNLHAEETIERAEVEREANPVRFESEREKVVHEWIHDFKWGKKLDEWVSYLSEDRAEQLTGLIKQWTRGKFGKGAFADPRHLEAAFVELLDSGRLDGFEIEVNKAKAQAEQELADQAANEAAEDRERQRKEDEKQEKIAEHAETVASLELHNARRTGLRTLRRKAIPRLSGEPIQTLPMPGTALRSDQISNFC